MAELCIPSICYCIDVREGGVGGDNPSTLLPFCLYQVDTIVVECSHTDSLVRFSTTVTVSSYFILLLLLLLVHILTEYKCIYSLLFPNDMYY